MPLIASAGLIATVSATVPSKPAALARLCGRRPVRADVAVERAVVQHVVGVPLGRQLQLRVVLHVIGTAGLMLDGVDVGDDAVVEPLVVGVGGGHARDRGSDHHHNG